MTGSISRKQVINQPTPAHQQVNCIMRTSNTDTARSHNDSLPESSTFINEKLTRMLQVIQSHYMKEKANIVRLPLQLCIKHTINK